MTRAVEAAPAEIAGKRRIPRWLVYALLCLFWWGTWSFLAKLGADRVAPMQLQTLFTLGMSPLALVAVARRRWSVETDRVGVVCGILNGTLTGLGLLAYYAALARGQASLVGPVSSLFPLLTVLLAALVLRERLNRVQVLGVACAVVAVVILSR